MFDATPQHIASLHPHLQPYVVWFVNAVRAAGVPLVIISSQRSPAANREAGGAERSLHLQGLAFDLAVLGYTRDEVPADWWQHLGLVWESLDGRWGGRFNPPDRNHFDTGHQDVFF